MHDTHHSELGVCPLCLRPLIPGRSINKHHLMPKSYGGREIHWMHVVCHAKIHSLFSLKELQHEYHDFAVIREHPDIQKFTKWISKKDPEFRTRHRRAKRKG